MRKVYTVNLFVSDVRPYEICDEQRFPLLSFHSRERAEEYATLIELHAYDIGRKFLKVRRQYWRRGVPDWNGQRNLTLESVEAREALALAVHPTLWIFAEKLEGWKRSLITELGSGERYAQAYVTESYLAE
jgi:hypothetical protein